jgi:hypothetical protein
MHGANDQDQNNSEPSMTTDELKTWPEFFQAIERGEKTFEVRYNDRAYESGDILELREWDPSPDIQYTGRILWRVISYVHHGLGPGSIEPLRGVVKGYCVLGIKPIEKLVTP